MPDRLLWFVLGIGGLLASACSPETHLFHLRRNLPLPGPAEKIAIEEPRYLIGNDAGVSAALRGDWKDARTFWEGLPANCGRLNNLALAFRLTGAPQAQVVDTLARALAACPGSEAIQWNYRAELVADGAVPPKLRKIE